MRVTRSIAAVEANADTSTASKAAAEQVRDSNSLIS